MRKIFFIIALCFLPFACAHIGTVEYDLKDAEFQAKNMPVRELRVWVFFDGGMDEINKIIVHLEKVSEIIESQVGIRLIMTGHWPIEYESLRLASRARKLRALLNMKGDQFDIAIGFGSLEWHEGLRYLVGLPVGLGMIEDTYRRYIVLKKMDIVYTIHEIFHAFVFSHAHSFTGVLVSIDVRLIQFLPSLTMGKYLSRTDREEVLCNKWRDFSQRINVKLK